MARLTNLPVQQFRGTTAKNDEYTGPEGELTVSTDTHGLRVHDGAKKGGHAVAMAAQKILAGAGISVSGGTLGVDNTVAVKPATEDALGGVIVGKNVGVNADGTISTKDWTAAVDELTPEAGEALAPLLYDTALVNATNENATVLGRAIGELAWSLLPIRSAGYHLLDGSLIYSTGIYAAFYNYMVQLKNSGSADAAFCTETEWQNSVTKYGVCGKFVLNTTNGTVRLPKVTGHVEGTIDAAALGDLIEAGLPNITGGFGQVTNYDDRGTNYTNGAFVFGNEQGGVNGGTNVPTHFVNFDASSSSSIYGNSTTVQTQSIKGFIYIIVGTYAKTDLQVNIDNVTADLQKKTDAAAAAHAAMPSGVFLELEVPSSGGTVTAPADGYISMRGTATQAAGYVALAANPGIISTVSHASTVNAGVYVYLPVSAGAVVSVHFQSVNVELFRFVYCNGSAPSA